MSAQMTKSHSANEKFQGLRISQPNQN